MKTLRTCIDSVLAGVMISIGGIIYLNCPNRIVGAFLFSIGLITIMEFKFNLYTGKVGYARKIKDIPQLICILIMNAVGCAFIMAFPTKNASDVWYAKLEYSLISVLVKAIVCGILIYICIHRNKKHTEVASILTTLIAIPAFILCGAEHSIADICFMLAARDFSVKGLVFILVVVLGNAIGSFVISIWVDKRSKLYTDGNE